MPCPLDKSLLFQKFGFSWKPGNLPVPTGAAPCSVFLSIQELFPPLKILDVWDLKPFLLPPLSMSSPTSRREERKEQSVNIPEIYPV